MEIQHSTQLEAVCLSEGLFDADRKICCLVESRNMTQTMNFGGS